MTGLARGSIAINEVTTLHTTGGVAVVVIDSPPVNALGTVVRQGIQAALAAAQADTRVNAIVLMCAGRTFFAGADIREIGKPIAEPTLRQLQQQVEGSAKPVIAAMHGSALGGGLELAMAAHFRIALATTRFGFPEVKLGLLPGAGGTQRLPRLIGVDPALSMMTGGEPVGARDAEAMELIDKVVEGGDLFARAMDFATGLVGPSLVATRTRDKQAFWPERSDETNTSPLVTELRERYRGYAAAQNIIEAVTNAPVMPFDEGIAAEAALFEQLKASPQSAALRYGFFAERQASKMPDLPEGEKPARVERIAIWGSSRHAEAIADAARSAGIDIADRQANDHRGPADLHIVTGASPSLLEGDGALTQKSDAIIAVAPSVLSWPGLPVAPTPIGVDFGDPQLMLRSIEILANAGSASAIAALLQFARKLNLIGAVTVGPDKSVGERLREARDAQISALLADGVQQGQIDSALTGFGMPGITGLGCDMRGETRDESLPTQPSEAGILESILLAIGNQAAILVGEAAVARSTDIDVLAVSGLGWPGFEGGPLYWMDTRGLERTLGELREHEQRFGGLFTPAAGLIARVAENRPFVTGS